MSDAAASTPSTHQPKPPLTLAELASFPVTSIKSVGPKRAKALAKVDITSVLDLLTHYPRRYIDRTRQAAIADLAVGEEGMILAEVDRVSSRRIRGNRTMVTATLVDATGRISLTFFNQPWRERQLVVGTQAVVYGKVDTYQGGKTDE